MNLDIKHAESSCESFGAYHHNIYKDGRVVEFIAGVGPEPLQLSARSVAYLNSRLDL